MTSSCVCVLRNSLYQARIEMKAVLGTEECEVFLMKGVYDDELVHRPLSEPPFHHEWEMLVQCEEDTEGQGAPFHVHMAPILGNWLCVCVHDAWY
jgi:hypothetical protein